MNRNTFSKRAVSCFIALALVVSCIVTTYASSVAPFTGDTNQSTGQVKVTTNGGNIQYEIGDRSASTKSMYLGSPALGTHCKFTVNDTATRVFMYWLDEYSNRVYSLERTIEFTVGSRIHLRAVCARVTDEEHFVSYVNYGGTVLQNDSYANGTSISAPTDTKIPGFTFTGWSKSESEISSDNGDLVVYPQYTVNDESYTVELTNDDYVSGAGTYSNFETVNLKAEEKNGSGETFSYWKNADGEIVSYERNYSFRINYNTTLTAVYGEEVTPEPVIRISKINRDTTDMKITFYAERSVPETYTVVSHGMLMASGVEYDESQMQLKDAGDTSTSIVRKVYGTSNEPSGTFSLAKAKVSYVTNVTVRPFIVCERQDGSQVVVYGDVVCTTNGAA